ncbi:MAG: flagellar biosynthetic protein FliR [Cyanobacteria bacterium P01_H01_bin.74]
MGNAWLTINNLIAFALVLSRASGILVSTPLLNFRSIPQTHKVGLAVVFSLILFPLYGQSIKIPTDLFAFGALVFQEVAIGLLLGYVVNLVFSAIQMAAEYISLQMGLSIASIMDPITQTQSPVIGQIFFYFAAFTFLSLNIHHGLFLAIDRSFEWIPLGQFFGQADILSAGGLTERMIVLASDIFVMALLVGVPVMGVLLCGEVALGFVAKVMPQMNIFMVAIPLKVGVGFILLLISLPYFGNLLAERYAQLVQVLLGLYKT